MIIVKQTLWILMIGLFLFASCTTDSKKDTTVDIDELLTGRWTLTKGIRNGKIAPTLEGTYFEFKSDNTLTNNMMGSDMAAPFTRAEKLITQNNNGFKTDYMIDKITTDSLVLSTTIRNFKFNLSFSKVKN